MFLLLFSETDGRKMISFLLKCSVDLPVNPSMHGTLIWRGINSSSISIMHLGLLRLSVSTCVVLANCGFQGINHFHLGN